MKKQTIIILGLLLALFLGACSSVPSPENDKLPVTQQPSAPVETQNAASQETVPAPTDDVSLEEQLKK